MAHFAKLDENNTVIDLLRISNWDMMDEEGVESEAIGLEVVKSFTDYNLWVQASYNGSFRKRYPAIGYYYDPQRDAFICQKSADNFILDEDSLEWVPPVLEPEIGDWRWSFETNSWVEEVDIEGEASD